MKKRILTFVTVAVLLLSCMTFCVSAAEDPMANLKLRLSATVAACEKVCDVSDLKIVSNDETHAEIYGFLLDENPEYFHVESFSVTAMMGTNTIVDIRPVYTMSKSEYDARLDKLRIAADEMTKDLFHKGLTDVEKALLLHDRLATACEYTVDLDTRTPEFENDVFTAYSALVNGTAVCQGYSYAYIYLLERVGIKSEINPSFELGHAWNIVYLGGKPYHVDVTWDDPVGVDDPNYVEHTNFLRSTKGIISTDHTSKDYVTTPTDTAYDKAFWQDQYSAFVHMDGKLYFDRGGKVSVYDNGTVKECMTAEPYTVTNGEKEFTVDVTFAYYGGNVYYHNDAAVYKYDPVTDESSVLWEPTGMVGSILTLTVTDGIATVGCGYSFENITGISTKLSYVEPPKEDTEDDKSDPDNDITIVDASRVFEDVKRDKWYSNAINYCYSNGFVSGMTKTKYGLDTEVTRGMYVTILARIAGVDTSKNSKATRFSDVAKNKYYTAAVKWASENGIVSGMTEKQFAPDSPITRQQLCVMMVNFANFNDIDIQLIRTSIRFADADTISTYAKTEVNLCQRAGIVSGYNEGSVTTFKPNNTATRAEAAQILYLFHINYMA